MPEGRMLKKAICTSRRLSSLKTDTARLLYTWIIPHLDIQGRFFGDPLVIKGLVVPRLQHINPKQIESCLEDMVKNDLIIWYKVNNESYIEYTVFSKHQQLREDREKKSDIPPPTPGVIQEHDGSTPLQYNLREVNLSVRTPEQVRLCSLLKEKILINNPKAVIKDDSWYEHCRLLLEKDHKEEDEIISVILFSQQDDFWKCNILSMKSLRKQYDRLYMKMKSDKHGIAKQPNSFNIEDQVKNNKEVAK